MVSEFGTQLLITAGIGLLLLIFIIWRVRVKLRRARAVQVVCTKYGFRYNRLMASLGFALPRMEGDVHGLSVAVMHVSNRSYNATTFHIGVRAPTFGMAVVEPRSEVGSKGFIGALVEQKHVGANAIPMSDPQISKMFSVRGQDGAGLQHALAQPAVVQQLMALQRASSSVSIEWGLLKFYVMEILDDPDQISRLIDQGLALAQSLEQAVGFGAQPMRQG